MALDLVDRVLCEVLVHFRNDGALEIIRKGRSQARERAWRRDDD